MSHSRSLFVGKALYFFVYAGLGILLPFLNIHFREIGLSGTQIGLINTLGPLVAIFSGPIWGMMADRLGRMRLLLGIVTLGAMFAVMGLSAVKSFGSILLLMTIYNLFGSAIIPLVDSYNLLLLGEHRDRYSEQRIWGTIGFLATSPLNGFILERTGVNAIFWGYSICLGLFTVTVIGLPPMQARIRQAVFKGFAQMLKQKAWLVLAASLILVMLANNSWVNFLGIAMKQMGGSDGLVGTAWSMGALSELPVMLLGSRLLYRLGAKKMVTLGFFFYGLRMILYGLMPAPEWALGIGLMHGISFGFYWLGGVNYVSEIAPEELRATGQSMLATFYNIASVFGAPLIGWLFDAIGASWMFLLAGVIAWLGAGVFWSGRNR